jgi:trans-aconitate 2-methyltransferase
MKTQIMKKYQWNANEYLQFSFSQQKWARESIEKANLRKYERVLDVGCGDGRITAKIAEYLTEGSVLGIDNSEQMISLAKEKFPGTEYSNLTFKILDAKSLNFNNEFDIIVSNAALHWTDEHVKVLNGMYEGLKKGGRILLQMGGKGNVPEAFFVIDKMITHPRWLPYFNGLKSPYNFYSVEEYNSFMSKTKFRDVKVELVEKDMQHKGREGVTGWIRSTWHPYTQELPEELREEFIDDLFNEFDKNFPADKNGFYHAKAKRLIVEARK